jgi:hypothetical protein
MDFGIKNFIVKDTQKKTLIFECYNLVDPMKWLDVIFWGWCPTRLFKGCMVTSSSSSTLILGGNDFFNYVMSETVEFGKKNSRNFRGWMTPTLLMYTLATLVDNPKISGPFWWILGLKYVLIDMWANDQNEMMFFLLPTVRSCTLLC